MDDDRVTLMTMHAAKGLEFPVVFVIAIEEGLLPHERSKEDGAALEEERRLLFVAITRAREELQLSLARQREFRGQSRYVIPSQFLMELPHDDLEMVERVFAEQVRPQLSAEGLQRLAEMRAAGQFEPDEAVLLGGFSSEEARAALERMMTDAPADGIGGDDEPATMPSANAARLNLTTAAALADPTATDTRLAGANRARIDPDVFVPGMLVQHPEYGLGKITVASGIGPKRTVTVAFVAGAGQKKFLVVHSPLMPAKA